MSAHGVFCDCATCEREPHDCVALFAINASAFREGRWPGRWRAAPRMRRPYRQRESFSGWPSPTDLEQAALAARRERARERSRARYWAQKRRRPSGPPPVSVPPPAPVAPAKRLEPMRLEVVFGYLRQVLDVPLPTVTNPELRPPTPWEQRMIADGTLPASLFAPPPAAPDAGLP